MFQPTGQTACSVREIRPARAVSEVFESLRAGVYPWLLDSALVSERLGRFSFAGADPYLVVRTRGGRTEAECLRAVRPGLSLGRRSSSRDPLEIARELLPDLPSATSAGEIPFIGGAVGYLGYELAAHFESHHFTGIDDLGLPDLYLLFVDRVVVHDAATGKLYACALGFDEEMGAAQLRAGRAAEHLAHQIVAGGTAARSTAARVRARAPFSFFDASGYTKLVNAVLEEIDAGEIYQACLTHRSERDCTADPWALYRVLRGLNPAPFASYFELPEVAILGSSPERFLHLTSDLRVESRPIKGTRARGASELADRALRSALATSTKDRAENLMIVDLVRNDLGRVCEIGSVDVPDLMAIESYASVHQMVSTVRGRLRSDRDAFDLVRAAFPPGSMTGTPKIAAMRILDRLEPVRRGIYSGTIGYFDARGGADLCVVIRTILLRRGRAYLHSGGGIVADSDPGLEWRETLDKSELLEAALDGVDA